MAIFTPKKQEATSFNNGEQYRNGDAVQPEALNNLIEGVLYAQESGLTEEQEAKVDKIVINGNGDKFLADNGEYKEVSGGTTVTVNGAAVETFDADTKVDKVNTAFRLYGTKDGGTPTTYSTGWSASANIIPIYDRSSLGGYNSAGEVTTSITGAIKTAIPEKPDHATPKKYVDEKTALYQHKVTFKFYRISDNHVIDNGTLVILSKSATLIDNVEELRKYVGQVVFADCTAGKGATRIKEDPNGGVLEVTIGEITAIIYTASSETEATTLEDSRIEL